MNINTSSTRADAAKAKVRPIPASETPNATAASSVRSVRPESTTAESATEDNKERLASRHAKLHVRKE